MERVNILFFQSILLQIQRIYLSHCALHRIHCLNAERRAELLSHRCHQDLPGPSWDRRQPSGRERSTTLKSTFGTWQKPSFFFLVGLVWLGTKIQKSKNWFTEVEADCWCLINLIWTIYILKQLSEHYFMRIIIRDSRPFWAFSKKLTIIIFSSWAQIG